MMDGSKRVADRSLASGGTQPGEPALEGDDGTAEPRLGVGRTRPPGGASAASPSASADAVDHDVLFMVAPDHYIVGEELGRGGMGRVLRARDRRLGRPVAIKELKEHTDYARARFVREARITARLQHPAIVNILEAGTWADGAPFYAMKLVIGEPLDAVIADRRSLSERLGLLPQVIAVVDALAYAHSVRVIHRDLKPSNVVVGAFGETVVIDWGLAKDLTATGDDPEVAAAPRPAAIGDTEAGAIMGTPAYMPPEQARGQNVDERADVYSLGAILYHVLSGARPYPDKRADALDALRAGPPPALTDRRIPPDLVTIVNKAMARDAADRYPTAGELADDLKKFQTGQLVGAHQYTAWQRLRRWLRANRKPAAVAAIGAVVVVALVIIFFRRILAEQTRAEHQRAAAVSSRKNAEDLMDFMLVDLRGKLQPLGRLDLLDDVAKQAVTYYDRRGTDLSDAELSKRALARRNLGDVLLAQGHADDALREYRASLAITETLAAKDPTNADRQAYLAGGHGRVGDVVFKQGDAAAALAEYRASLAVTETLGAKEPTNADRQADLLVLYHERIGNVLVAQGNAVGALAEYRASLAMSEALVAKDPTNADRQRNLAVNRSKVGDVLFAQGDAAAALAEYRASLAISETLAKKESTNADRQRDLSLHHSRVGEVLLAQGDAAGALAEYRASFAIRNVLATKDPTNADRQADLSAGHLYVGDVLLAQRDAAGALAEYRASLAICETLAAKDSTNADRQRDLSVGHYKVGAALFAQGDAAGALASFRAYLAISETLAAKDPTNADRQADLAISHAKVGEVLLAQGNAAGALAEYRASLEISEKLAAKDPANADWQQNLAFSHEVVGDVLLAEGDATAALAEYRASLAIRKMLATKDSTNASRPADVSTAHLNVGNALLAQGDAAGALAEYRLYQAGAAAVAARNPEDPVWQGYQAESHERVADALLAQRDRVGALAEYQVGLAIAQRLQAKDPKNVDVREQANAIAHKVATCCGAKGTKHPP